MRMTHPLTGEKKILLGAEELVTLRSGNGNEQVMARIDTGAKMSSMDLSLAMKLGLRATGSKKTVRSSHGRSEREVVVAEVDIGGDRMIAEFTVIDRSHMTFPLLVGRNILEKGFIVDPSKDAVASEEREE